MENKYATFFLGVFFCLINNSSIYSQTIYDIDDVFCLEKNIYDCLSDVLNEADVILEVTYIHEKYDQPIRTNTYQVEKIFKGNVGDTIEVKNNLKEYYRLYSAHIHKSYPEVNIGKFNPNETRIYPPKRKTTIMSLKNDSSGLIPILYFFPIMYDVFNTNPTLNTNNLVYVKLGQNELKFKTADDVYDFILKHDNTHFRDITFRKFIKKRFNSLFFGR